MSSEFCRHCGQVIGGGSCLCPDEPEPRMLDVGHVWDRLSETQRASILKMARMERGWHYASVEVRYNAEDHHFDGTWLREVLRAFAKCEGTEQPVHDEIESATAGSFSNLRPGR